MIRIAQDIGDPSPTARADTSPEYSRDAPPSPRAAHDVSPGPRVDGAPGDVETGRCAWCRKLLRATTRLIRYCSKRCRQTAHRARRNVSLEALGVGPLLFSYADPPYPGLARKYYGKEATYGGEVDHAELIARLERRRATGDLGGWALSTSGKAGALTFLLPLCPPDTLLCPWVKPIGVSSRTRGAHNTWEALIVVPGRRLRPGVRDWLLAQPARFGGTLPGRKPLAFVRWLWSLLGACPGDQLEDLYPGTGVVGRAWAELSRAAAGDTSRKYSGDTSPKALSDGAAP